MEWAKETAKTATNTVLDPIRDSTGKTMGADTANQAYDAAANPSDTASAAYEQASEYVPDVTSSKTTSSAVLNSAPFRSFKPDPSIVWQGHLIYIILAAGSTIPWWAFIFGADYFQYLYPGTHIVRLFAFAYYVPWLIAYILVTFFWREGSSWVKINIGGAASITALLVIALMNGIAISEKGTTATFWVTLGLVGLAGVGDAISQGSILGISSELPVSFTKSYCCGTVVSGVFAFTVRLITKLCLSSSAKGLRISGIVYFSITALFVVLALALLAYIHSMPEMGYYTSLSLGSFDTVRLLIQDEDNVTIEVASGAAIAAVAAGRTSKPNALAWRPVLGHIKLLAIAVFVTSFLTLSIFPGVLAEDIPQWSQLGDYSLLLLLGSYVIGDLCGRLFTVHHMTMQHSSIFGAAWARLFLVALFFLAILFDPSVISSLIMMMILTAILGFSNGYLICSLTVIVPKATPSQLAETAGILNALFMNLGVLAGAGLCFIGLSVAG